MADAQCPEPKPVLIVLCGLGGALAGFVGSVSGFAIRFHEVLELKWAIYTSTSFGIAGTVIGVTIALSRITWVRLLLAPFMGLLAGAALKALAMQLWGASSVDAGQVFLFGATGTIPLAFCTVLAHSIYLASLDNRRIRLFIWTIYPVLGFLVSVWSQFVSEPWHSEEIMNIEGILFGLLQLLAMLAALAIHRKIRPRLQPPPASPAPGPGP